jgi:Domain of unknown function (DUF4365)
MTLPRYNPTERIGVSAVEQIVVAKLHWIFREQPIMDMGIDAHIELVDKNSGPTGKLIGVQIKTGVSHVEKKSDHYLYYGDLTHLEYWLSHSLPVVLVVHFPQGGTFWQAINDTAVSRTAKGWKTQIPFTNVFGPETQQALEGTFAGTPKQQRQIRLALDEPLMRHVDTGGKVVVEMQDWVNKSLGRTPVDIYVIDDAGNETLTRSSALMYVGYNVKQLAQRIFPWADIHIDEEFYEQNAPEESLEERLSRASARDNGIEGDPLTSKDIRPYDEAGGEVECYRLELKLNEVGRAYLALSNYLNTSEDDWAHRDDAHEEPYEDVAIDVSTADNPPPE